MSQDGPNMAPTWPKMVQDVCLALSWAFIFGCLGRSLALPSLCLRCAFALPSLCFCFAFALPYHLELYPSLFFLGIIPAACHFSPLSFICVRFPRCRLLFGMHSLGGSPPFERRRKREGRAKAIQKQSEGKAKAKRRRSKGKAKAKRRQSQGAPETTQDESL